MQSRLFPVQDFREGKKVGVHPLPVSHSALSLILTLPSLSPFSTPPPDRIKKFEQKFRLRMDLLKAFV